MIKLFPLENLEISGTKVNTYAMIQVDDEIEIIIEPTLFLSYLSLEYGSQETVRGYGRDLLKFFRELKGVYSSNGTLGQDFREVSNDQMNAYINAYLRQKEGLKLATINRHISSLKAFYDYIYTNGWMSERKDYSFSLRKDAIKTSELEGIATKLTQEYMDETEFKKLLDSVPTTNHFKNKRDRLALMLGYYVGFRSGELVNPYNLRVDYIEDLIVVDDHKVPRIEKPMRILGKGNKERKARVSAEIVQPLYEFLRIAKKLGATHLMCKLDGSPLKDRKFGTDLFRDTADLTLLSGNLSPEEAEQWIMRHFHCGRKCYATNSVTYCYHPNIQLDHRTHVTNWMGHSHPKTTEIYIYFEALLHQRHKILKEMDFSKMLGSFHQNVVLDDIDN